jgi:hypothetical protein
VALPIISHRMTLRKICMSIVVFSGDVYLSDLIKTRDCLKMRGIVQIAAPAGTP